MASVYDFTVTDIRGNAVPMSTYAGRTLLIVNTASKCGFTPQFEGLEALWQAHRDSGLTVLGFPCNQFGGQDPGSNDEIGSFCQLNYGVSFPMHAKVDVNGAATDPLFAYLKRTQRGLLGTQRIKWNFTKFLIDRRGQPVARFSPRATPASLTPAIAAHATIR